MADPREDSIPELVACNLCGGSQSTEVGRLPDFRLRIDDRTWTIVKCDSCGLLYLNPRPTADEIGYHYPAAYYAHRPQLRGRSERQAAFVTGSPGRLLDIGTATGAFLEVMIERGWQVAGIESSAEPSTPQALPIAHVRFPEESPFSDEEFDVITAWAAFEHLHDPARAFAECRRMLKPGGRLIIQVPNAAALGRGLRFQDVPRHLYFFTEETLRRYGAQANLHMVSVDHTPDFYGGSGRQVLRLALLRSLGRSREEFEEMYRLPRRERFRRWPLLTVAWIATAALERVVLADWVVRAARISGTITVHFERPAYQVASPLP